LGAAIRWREPGPEALVLTVILALKDPCNRQLRRCLAAIAALRDAREIALTIVFSGKQPEIPSFVQMQLAKVCLVETPPHGVYAAYNRGLEEGLEAYVVFLGVDDILLPGLDQVLEWVRGLSLLPDVVVCRVLMQDVGLSGASLFRRGLIFRNWCHQGILYNAKIFTRRRYDLAYFAQADHKLNIELAGERTTTILRRKEVICYFSSGGVSSCYDDLRFRKDMPQIVSNAFGKGSGFLTIARRSLADIGRLCTGNRIRVRDNEKLH
jgi:hypothetical protein